MKRIASFLGPALLACLPAHAQAPAPAPAALPPPAAAEELPLEVATQWAHATIAACKADGYAVTATYMTPDLTVKLAMRADGARPGTVEVGRRKAYTVIKSGMSSGAFGASVAPAAGAPAPAAAPGQPPGMPPGANADPNMIIWAGGLPVKAGSKLLGAVAVSGAPGGDKDVACANAGLAKIASALK